MPISLRRRAKVHLYEIIAAYRATHEGSLDHHAIELLGRMVESAEICSFFERLRNEDQGDKITPKLVLRKCIQTEQLARSFKERITKASEALSKTSTLRNSIDILRKFLDEICAEEALYHSRSDLISPFGWPPPEDISQIRNSLRLLEDEIVERRSIAEDDPRRLGATRKFRDRRAAENAAIGWLAEAVRELTGKTHFSAVADLSQVILKTKREISLDRVRHAARSRRRQTNAPLSR